MPNNLVFNYSNDPLHTEISDGGDSLNIVDSAAEVIDIAHAEIHEGNYYSFTKFFQAVASSSYADVHLTTGATKKVHASLTFNAEAKSYLYLYRGTTYTSIGTPITIYNNNDTSTKTTESVAYYTPSINNLGTLLLQDFVSGGVGPRTLGGSLTSRNEMILKINTDYLFRVQNVGGSSVTSDTSVTVNYYEL